MLFTLDSHPEAIISHPDMMANQFCRTTIRVRRWGDQTMRDLLARPVQAAVVDASRNIKSKLWKLCDDDLKACVTDYLERANG